MAWPVSRANIPWMKGERLWLTGWPTTPYWSTDILLAMDCAARAGKRHGYTRLRASRLQHAHQAARARRHAKARLQFRQPGLHALSNEVGRVGNEQPRAIQGHARV